MLLWSKEDIANDLHNQNEELVKDFLISKLEVKDAISGDNYSIIFF